MRKRLFGYSSSLERKKQYLQSRLQMAPVGFVRTWKALGALVVLIVKPRPRPGSVQDLDPGVDALDHREASLLQLLARTRGERPRDPQVELAVEPAAPVIRLQLVAHLVGPLRPDQPVERQGKQRRPALGLRHGHPAHRRELGERS